MVTLHERLAKELDTIELRILGVFGKRSSVYEGYAKGTVSGYFNDPVLLEQAAAAMEKLEPKGIYFTLNPVNPALLNRAVNRLKVPKVTTQDKDIVCIRWLPLDFDPRRPTEISASNEEVALASGLARDVAAWLEGEMGFSRALRAFSGNGFHLLYRLNDLPNNEETHKLIVSLLAVIKEKFDNDQVNIDAAMVNAARIIKYYGTTGRKGDSTDDRPHRKSYIFPNQPETFSEITITPQETLQTVAGLAASAASTVPVTSAPVRIGKDLPATTAAPKQNANRFKESELGPINMELYLTHYGVQYEIKQKGAQTLYVLDKCLFNPDHGKGDASIIVSPTGPLLYQCFHASCKGTKKWHDARKMISGDKPIAEFCAGYDPNWSPPKSAGSGALKDIQVSAKLDVHSASDLVPPSEINPLEFFEKRGKRPVFVTDYLANYLAGYLHPLVCTDDIFWRYTDGVWAPFPKGTLMQIICQAMKDHIQPGFIDGTLKVLAGKLNQEETAWPNDIRYINLQNGVFNIEDLKLLPHDPAYGHRQRLPVNYIPESFSEKWHKFLAEVFPDDETYEKRYVLQQFFAYCLLRDCRYQKALFCYGTGSNGKTTILDVLQAIVGEANTSSLSLLDLSNRFRTQFLQGKLVNLASETNTRDPIATEMFKAAISGDSITAERKYGHPYQFKPYAKFIVSMNDAPVIPDRSFGLSRRIITLNFLRRFEKSEIIPEMSKLLIEDKDSIFAWIVEGLGRLLKQGGFHIGGQVIKDGEEMMENMNALLIFFREMCVTNDPDAVVASQELWDLYKAWCHDGNNRALGRNKFLEEVKKNFRVEKCNYSQGERRQHLKGFGVTEEARRWLSEYQQKNRGKQREE